MLILSIVLVGCNNEEKVKVEFKMKNICKVVEVNKGSVITDNIIPFDDKNIELNGAEFKLYDAKTGGNEIKVVKVREGVYRVATAEEIENNEVVEFIVGGKVTIKGLAKDTSYYLEETKAPDGYTKLAERYEIKAGTNEVSMVVNTSGVVLPSTGGIGTTLFVLIGTIMVLSLGTVLVSKYRMTKFNA